MLWIFVHLGLVWQGSCSSWMGFTFGFSCEAASVWRWNRYRKCLPKQTLVVACEWELRETTFCGSSSSRILASSHFSPPVLHGFTAGAGPLPNGPFLSYYWTQYGYTANHACEWHSLCHHWPQGTHRGCTTLILRLCCRCFTTTPFYHLVSHLSVNKFAQQW